MECPKCNGMLRLERLSDFFFAFYTWNCINCGAIIDRTISHNRRKSRAAKSAKVAPKSFETLAVRKSLQTSERISHRSTNQVFTTK